MYQLRLFNYYIFFLRVYRERNWMIHFLIFYTASWSWNCINICSDRYLVDREFAVRHRSSCSWIINEESCEWDRIVDHMSISSTILSQRRPHIIMCRKNFRLLVAAPRFNVPSPLLRDTIKDSSYRLRPIALVDLNFTCSIIPSMIRRTWTCT